MPIVRMSRGEHMIDAGIQAPTFEVQNHLGETVRLSDYEGKNVILWFYPKADTPG